MHQPPPVFLIQTNLLVQIRPAIPTDRYSLKWNGSDQPSWPKALDRVQKQEIVMLVATINNFCVSEIWIDLVRRKHLGNGFLYHFGTIEPLRSLGIGRNILASTEEILKTLGFPNSELAVEKTNHPAQRLYLRQGYQISGDIQESWEEVNTFTGQTNPYSEDCWLMSKKL